MKERKVSSAEIQAGEVPVSLSQTHPKHIYFLMCYPAPSQKRLILQAESSLLCSAWFYYLSARFVPFFLNKTVPNLTFGEDRTDSPYIDF